MMGRIKEKAYNCFHKNESLAGVYNSLSHCKMFIMRCLSDESFLKIKYRAKMGKELNLNPPVTYNEKLQWIKLYDHNPLYTQLVDKYSVRDYVKSVVGEQYLNQLYGVFDSVEEIDFDKLPNQFVLKCTHDSGNVIVCMDKSSLNVEKAKKKLNTSLRRNYFWDGREWPYKNVKPRIIAEKFLVDESGYELKDYKFYAFNGTPAVCFLISDRGHETKCDPLDMEFKRMPFNQGYPCSEKEWEKPANYDEMKEVVSKLSMGIPEVRVDLYNVGGQIIFGEMTFFDAGGMAPFYPDEWDKTFGDMIDLSLAYPNK